MERFVINVDGAVGSEASLPADAGKRGAGLGVVIRDAKGRVCHLLKEWVPGPVTSCEAEYAALLLALQALLPFVPCQLTLFSDSQVMVNQLIGRFRVNSKRLKPLHRQATMMLASFPHASISFVPRGQNRLADALAWEAANGWQVTN
jgi:ribonuclease HI